MFRVSIFYKIVIVIILLLIPIIVLYSFSNSISMEVVLGELQNSNLKQLSYFLSEVESSINQLSLFGILLSNDPDVEQFRDISLVRQLYDKKQDKRLLCRKN